MNQMLGKKDLMYLKVLCIRSLSVFNTQPSLIHILGIFQSCVQFSLYCGGVYVCSIYCRRKKNTLQDIFTLVNCTVLNVTVLSGEPRSIWSANSEQISTFVQPESGVCYVWNLTYQGLLDLEFTEYLYHCVCVYWFSLSLYLFIFIFYLNNNITNTGSKVLHG